ncbi:protein kinase [Streptomyces sp. NPDC059452]|uniref:protein kinase n=1 Tax=Streptomyces sp. NPDC059452 TaxID=3346835 RepID=UPI0036C0FAA9
MSVTESGTWNSYSQAKRDAACIPTARTTLTPREGTVLHRIGSDDSAAYGEWERGTWNVQPWREGPDLYELWKPCREPGSRTEPHSSEALGCVEAPAELHAMGWAHGDVQPAHFIIGPERTHLIDLALARGGHVPEQYDFPFRGCLVHYEAPEIARSVLATGEAEATQEADVYALGASLLISATGRRAVEYPDDAPRPEQRRAVASGRRRPVRAPGELGGLIDTMLSPDPGDRPTIQEVRGALRQASLRADAVAVRETREAPRISPGGLWPAVHSAGFEPATF